ncbi:MAG: efflux RND transporter periplasmic adaptor subunit [bacterium]|nr:efflux RND transporter periplasmic adaptor subunit [bacterium]
MKKRILLIGFLLFVAILGWRIYSTSQRKAELKAQRNPVVVPRVEVTQPVNREAKETIESWGTAEANRTVPIQSTVNGKLLRWKVSEGKSIQPGEILAIVDRDLAPQEFNRVEVISSTAGVFTKQLVDEGASITPQTMLGVIEDLATIVVPVKVSQNDVGKIRNGMAVEFDCSSYPNTIILGVVKRIDNVSDPVSHATRVEVVLHDQRIKPGMHLRAFFLLQKYEALFIPTSSVLEQDTTSIAAVVKNGRVSRVKINVGMRRGDWRIVRSGLTTNDSIIVSGVDQFYDGDSVVVARSVGQ